MVARGWLRSATLHRTMLQLLPFRLSTWRKYQSRLWIRIPRTSVPVPVPRTVTAILPVARRRPETAQILVGAAAEEDAERWALISSNAAIPPSTAATNKITETTFDKSPDQGPGT
jgi:hypothetical protein